MEIFRVWFLVDKLGMKNSIQHRNSFNNILAFVQHHTARPAYFQNTKLDKVTVNFTKIMFGAKYLTFWHLQHL